VVAIERRGLSRGSAGFVRSERSQWNRLRSRAWGNVSASRSKLTAPAAPLHRPRVLFGKVSVLDAVGFAAEWGIAFRVDGLKRQRRHEPLKAVVAIEPRWLAL